MEKAIAFPCVVDPNDFLKVFTEYGETTVIAEVIWGETAQAIVLSMDRVEKLRDFLSEILEEV